MSRSLKKGPYVNERLLKRVMSAKQGARFKTWARDASITPEMVGFTFEVHNGKIHIPVFVSENMVGHKLGEFSPSHKFIRHGGKLAKDEAAGAVVTAAPSAKPAGK